MGSCEGGREVVERTPTIKSFFLRLSARFTHAAGQHVDVRLTAPDGYVAMRSYSIASAPSSADVIELAIERLPDGEVSSIITDTARAAHTGTDQGLQEILDFLVTQEQLSVTFVSAAIERAEGTPSAAFLPVLRNAVTTEFHHVEVLRKAGAQPHTARFWLPDAAFDNGGVGVFSTAEIVESVEIGWPTVAIARDALEGLGIGYGKQGNGAGRFYEYPGDPVARGIGTPVNHIVPA